MDITEIARAFAIDGEPLSAIPLSGGHINDTCKISTSGSRYVLQRINSRVLKDPPLVMENIAAVTAHLRAKGMETLTIIPTLAGGPLHKQGGDYYRMYAFIENAESRLSPLSAEDFRAAGAAFGSFVEALGDMPVGKVHQIPKASHDTAFHLAELKRAVRADEFGRAKYAGREIELAMQKSRYASLLRPLLISGELPLRIVHNDTKYSNIMVDTATHKARCVLDLDNVMPGSALTDYGDAIRSGCDGGGFFRAELVAPYRAGFLGAVELTELETELLPAAPLIITYENAIRYLTDYLSGDTYFKIRYPGHNLEKFRARMRLLEDMEASPLCGI